MRPFRWGVGGLYRHRAELKHGERASQPAAALLSVENGSTILEPDKQGRHRNEWGVANKSVVATSRSAKRLS